MGLKQTLIGAGFKAFAVGRLHRLAPAFLRGQGVILTLHRVRPRRDVTPGYAPNALLEITPDFLQRALARLETLGFEFVSLEEAARRLGEATAAPFASLTFDDGYRDFVSWALPILERHRAPLTMFLATGMIEPGAELWWLELEEAIRRLDFVEIAGERLPARTPREKSAAYETIYWRLRALAEPDLLGFARDLAARAGVSDAALREGLFLGWREVEALARHPLVAIGAHSHRHLRLSHWPVEAVRQEMAGSKAALEARLQKPVAAFSYPVGDRSSAGPREFALARACGFRLGVTTRPGMLFAEHADHLLALPRVSLNGLWQDERHLDALMSGAPFAIWNRGRRLDVG